MLPEISDQNRFFWTSGERNELQITQCSQCSYYIHPPAPICPNCLNREVAPATVSGRATVMSYTINYQEQAGLNLTTNLINTPVESVAIGMPVKVVFEDCGEVFVPLFEPSAS
jgi:uncharacterized OB-fold protein